MDQPAKQKLIDAIAFLVLTSDIFIDLAKEDNLDEPLADKRDNLNENFNGSPG